MIRSIAIVLLLPFLCIAQNTEVGPIGNTPQKIDTLAGLIGRPGTNSQMLVVLGHSAVGDWGAQRNAVFDAGSTESTNLGCVFYAPGGRWKFPDCDGEVDVRWFGASGTNSTANVSAIQAAIAYAESRTPNAAVLIDGDYTLNASLTVRSATIRGRHFLDLNAVNQSSTLRMEHGNTNDVLVLTSTNNLKPRVENLRIFATGESGARSKVAILSVSSRTNFVVATNHVPASNPTVGEWPYYGHCFFYSAEGRYLGSGVVITNDATTGAIVLEPTSDKYAVPIGSTMLTTDCTVAFSPVITEVITYLGGSSTNTMADPTRVGPVGIRIDSKGYAVIENVDVMYAHCALAVGFLNTGLQLRNFSATAFKFAGVAGLRRAQNSDAWCSRIRLNGTYLQDTTWPSAEALTFDDTCFRRAHSALWLPGYTSSFDDFLAYSIVHGVVLDRAYHVTGGNWILDDVTHDGIVYFSGSSNPDYLQTAVAVGTCIIRPSFFTDEPVNYSMTNAAVKVYGNGYAKLDFGSLIVEGVNNATRTNKFDYMVDVQSFKEQWVSASHHSMTGARLQYNDARDRLYSQSSLLQGDSGIPATSIIRSEIAQSGTAGYAGQLLYINEQTVGSGVGRYQQMLLGNTNRYIHEVTGSITHTAPNSGNTRFEYWKSDGATNSEIRLGWGAPSVNSRLELRGNEIRSAVASTAATNTLVFQSAGGVSDFYGPTVFRGNSTFASNSLNVIQNLTGGNSSNFFRGDGTFATVADTLVVPNIANLLSLSPTTNDTRWVQGWTTAGDWGAPRQAVHRKPSALTTNLGCVFAATGGGQWVFPDCEGGEIDVRWFGADATGTLPSSAAIQAATDYTMQTWGQASKGVVIFPVGTFLIDATITNAADPLASRTIWRGQTKALIGQHTDEWHTVLKAAPNLNAPIVSFSNPRHVAITGIAFNGDRDNQSGFTGTGLVELVGGWGALESDLTDVAVFQSKTNGIYILRHVVQFERVHSIFNDYDGIRFNEYPGGDPTRPLGDCSLQNVQVGFNKGTGIRFNHTWTTRSFNVDVYFNNENGMSINGGGQFRTFGLNANNNGQNGLLISGNTRDLVFNNCLFNDSNWPQFENYSDTGITEATNTAPSGTYHNVNIVGDGNNWETSFIACRFWQTPGGFSKKVGYLLYDGHPAAGQYITMIDPRLIDSTNHWDLGIANGAWLTNATMVGTRYGGTNAFTKFAEPVRRTTFSDTDYRGVVEIERSDPSPHLRLYRPDNDAWVTMDLGKGFFRQFADEGIFEFGNTNSASAGGMTRVNYMTIANFWSTNANTLMLSGIGRTNPVSGLGDNDLRIGGGGESFDAFNRVIFYTATNLTGSTGGVARLEIRPEGQVDFFPLAADPTVEVQNGQVYFNTTNGLTQRRGGAWEKITPVGSYLPLAGGAMTGPVTSSSTWSGNSFTATGASAALWTQVRSATTNSWAVFSAAQPLTFYWLPSVGGGYATHYFDTNGSINSLQGTFFNTGNDGSGSTLDADLLDGLDSTVFSQTNHLHTGVYLPLAGGTVTGPVIVTNDPTLASIEIWNNPLYLYDSDTPTDFGQVIYSDEGYLQVASTVGLQLSSAAITLPNIPAESVPSTNDLQFLVVSTNAVAGVNDVNKVVRLGTNNVKALLGIASTNTLSVAGILYTVTNLYDDIFVPIATLDPPGIATPPQLVANSGRDGESLAAVFNAGDITQFNVQLTHDVLTNGIVYPHIHVEEQTTTGNTNTWIVKYAIADINGTFPAWTRVTNTVAQAAGQWAHRIVTLPTNGISMAGFNGPSTGIKIRIECVSTTNDVHVIFADTHIPKRGSPVAYTP